MASGVKTKKDVVIIYNNDEDITKLNKTLTAINNNRCSLSSTLWTVLSTILGLFSVEISVAAAAFNMGALPTSNMFTYLEKMYTEIYLDMTYPPTGGNIESVTITQKYTGTYQGKNKDYVYVAEKPTYKTNYR
nr:hypothetical protein [uncultured Aminipila sp.]